MKTLITPAAATQSSFQPSELGNKNYWDGIYSIELNNFNNFGDNGDVWYGEDTEEKVMNVIMQLDGINPETSRIIDLGCGNGNFLRLLYECGFRNLHGVDYSATGISLASEIFHSNNRHMEKCLRFSVLDVLTQDSDSLPFSGTWNLVHDKGTLDAISLTDDFNPLPYVNNICRLMATKSCSFFIITSCNWTTEEICSMFYPYLIFYQEVKYPKFSFGGVSGSKISTVIFTKKQTNFVI